jgi:hypothetical protein
MRKYQQHHINFSKLYHDCKDDNHSHELSLPLASPHQKPGEFHRKISAQPICPHCGSTNLIIGAGKRPGEESRRCQDCKHFLGYSPLAKLKKARRRKELTECLEILENQGIQGYLAIFTLSLAADGGDTNA